MIEQFLDDNLLDTKCCHAGADSSSEIVERPVSDPAILIESSFWLTHPTH
ncbi:MAG: hypothetical protein K1563_17550 [Candidatus Thiodiazotropha sp. (ex. Lucinisca nassula)]|nr:hypothetical protein [Candidatus Thiodiazotropha sp. (ex. Lucinisca nassula)]MBW9275487.1 hypothetical protein [Candidatus Thiodiazotropha sp. (ex. Lucinisca nassula)]